MRRNRQADEKRPGSSDAGREGQRKNLKVNLERLQCREAVQRKHGRMRIVDHVTWTTPEDAGTNVFDE
jgi:hypothetical protein